MDKNNFQLIVGNQIRLHRRAQGISQEQLAELAEVHHTYISNIERGKVSASAYSLYRIAQALGVNLCGFFGMLDNECDLDFENDLVEITGRMRKIFISHLGMYMHRIGCFKWR